MRVTIFGAAYVGLVTGTCFAERGNDVVCVDIDAAKIDMLRCGEVPMFEPGLAELVRANVDAGRLRFTTSGAEGVDHGEVIFIAVGTPPGEDGSADMSQALSVARTIGECMTEPKVVVSKSTVPVGAADQVRDTIRGALAERGVEVDFDIASNPEFLKEGSAVSDFMKPDRIVIGSDSNRAKDLLERLYAPFNRNHDRIIHMDLRSAELTKYAANVMLATRISLMNEFAGLADRLGADVEAVRRGIGADPRIGFHFIYAGCGYGGSCFPKDVRALIGMGREVGYDTAIVRGVDDVNRRQHRLLAQRISAHFGGSLAGRTIALWGLSFKPNTDDMREAPSRTLMEGIWAGGGRVRAYDPQAMQQARMLYGERDDLVLVERREQALDGADALAVVTEWNEFHSPDFDEVKARLKTPTIFDGRNLYLPDAMRALGFDHIAIGRPPVYAHSTGRKEEAA